MGQLFSVIWPSVISRDGVDVFKEGDLNTVQNGVDKSDIETVYNSESDDADRVIKLKKESGHLSKIDLIEQELRHLKGNFEIWKAEKYGNMEIWKAETTSMTTQLKQVTTQLKEETTELKTTQLKQVTTQLKLETTELKQKTTQMEQRLQIISGFMFSPLIGVVVEYQLSSAAHVLDHDTKEALTALKGLRYTDCHAVASKEQLEKMLKMIDSIFEDDALLKEKDHYLIKRKRQGKERYVQKVPFMRVPAGYEYCTDDTPPANSVKISFMREVLIKSVEYYLESIKESENRLLPPSSSDIIRLMAQREGKMTAGRQ